MLNEQTNYVPLPELSVPERGKWRHCSGVMTVEAVSLERWCCPLCGGRRVEVLDWVSVNGGRLIGGDAVGEYFCPDCEAHPARVEARAVPFALCDSCEAHGWGTRIPLPGVLVTAHGHIERCDACAIYESDLGAAEALAAETARRSGESTGRIRHFVEGYDA